jgi:hypothetical protein
MRRSFGLLRFSPRPQASNIVRKYSWQTSGAYIEDAAGVFDTRDWDVSLGVEFHNSDQLGLSYSTTRESLSTPFRIARDIVLPVGEYDYRIGRASFTFGQQRKMSAAIEAEHGSFYNGRKTTLGITQGRISVTSQLSFEPTYSFNRVRLPQGNFTTHLLGSRVTNTLSPMMFVSALVQYNSGTRAVNSNIRLRWEYQPGSELFVVYNEERNTLTSGFPDISNRALVVKVNRLFRF